MPTTAEFGHERTLAEAATPAPEQSFKNDIQLLV